MTTAAPPRLDIVIPVYNEGANILRTLQSIARAVTTPKRVLICYDREDDDTLPAIRDNRAALGDLAVDFVRNRGRGAQGAVLSGFAAGRTPYVVMVPADDDYNAADHRRDGGARRRRLRHRLRQPLHARRQHGRLPLAKGAVGARRQFHALSCGAAADPRCYQRLSPVLAAHDRRDPVELDRGFCYSIELLVKCHRLGWRIGEVPANWIERTHGSSRFQVLRWLPAYLRWYAYAFATTYLGRAARTVQLKSQAT